jgi:DNA-binding transcriptional ArsR family regulator
MSIVAYTHIQVVMSADLIYMLKALVDENRIRILNLLRNGELYVCDIEAIRELNNLIFQCT